jgi:hypothetical protein
MKATAKDKAKSEQARQSWILIKARRAAGYYDKPKAGRQPAKPATDKPCRTPRMPSPVPEESIKLPRKMDIVKLYLITTKADDDAATDPCYAPHAPVCGQSYYVVLDSPAVIAKAKTVNLFHPWTLTRFEVPRAAFRPDAAIEFTPAKIAQSIVKIIEREQSLKRPVCKYVHQIVASLKAGTR